MPAKKRCQHAGGEPCKSAALRIVGDCSFCDRHFCGSHRLPEQHACPKMQDCRQEAFESNKLKLERERTVASKVAMA